MGEIGIPRHEFLYDLQFWEVRRIIKGYRRRGRLRDQLIAEATYAALFSNRDPKGKTVKDIYPFLFTDENTGTPDTPSEDDIAELQAEMDAINGIAQ